MRAIATGKSTMAQISNKRSYCWVNATESGLGDRLLNTFFALTVARKLDMSLCLEWKPYCKPTGDVPDYREKDILLENMRANIELPEDICILQNKRFPENGFICWEYYGHTSSCEFFPKVGCRHFCSLDEFQWNLASAVRDVKFVGLAKQAQIDLPKDLVSVHIRRTDKVRDTPDVDDYMISQDELLNLERLTESWIEDLLKSNKNFYICGDDQNTIARYEDIIKMKGGFLAKPAGIDSATDWEKTYIDLAVMSASSAILQSQKNSSFSRFAALVGDTKLINVYTGENTCI